MQMDRLLADGWRFSLGWDDRMAAADYDDSAWRQVAVPHDWSIEGEFSPDAPAYCRGAWLPTGMGAYRRHFRLTQEECETAVSLYFEGVWRNSEIFVNGTKVGGREWGYISFGVEVPAGLLHAGDNVLAVKVDNSAPLGCRWYSGSGIYRPVHLEFRHPRLHFPRHAHVVTAVVDPEKRSAAVELSFSLRNRDCRRLTGMLRNTITDPAGKVVYDVEKSHAVGTGLEITLWEPLQLDDIALWSPDSPSLYTWESVLTLDGRIADRTAVRFGLRKLEFDADDGFKLNGVPTKIKGVCLHNDGGALGAACGKNTFVRQLAMLKTMGCNAVRTSHHPYAPAFLDACDEVGMLVLAEFFDEWSEPIWVGAYADGEVQGMKANYYSAIFDRCAVTDLSDAVRRDRNHASIFMWSIGNEVQQMRKYSGHRIAGTLIEAVRNLDATRPVTCALVTPPDVNHENMDLLDVIGCNYPSGERMDEFHRRHPNQPMIVTECCSAQTRRPLGVYCAEGKLERLGGKYPGQLEFIRKHEEMLPGITAWRDAAARPFIIGQFIWTGWDYLGEITPYDFPAHYSVFGVIDACGRPKDGYYYYRAVWRDAPVLHIASHWDFAPGDRVKVRVISNTPRVELFLNGRSLGVQEGGEVFAWELDYEPGELVARGERGGETLTDRVVTSGDPAKLELFRSGDVPAPGDFGYFVCRVLDEKGDVVRNAPVEVKFTVLSGGELAAVDNGDQMSLEPFRGTDSRRTCDGHALCIVKADGTGPIRVRAQGTWQGRELPAATAGADR